MNAAAPSPVPPHLVDAQGLVCPMPLLKLRQALHGLQIGESVRVLTTDPNSQQDIRRYCERSGQNLLATWQDAQTFGFDIQKML